MASTQDYQTPELIFRKYIIKAKLHSIENEKKNQNDRKTITEIIEKEVKKDKRILELPFSHLQIYLINIFKIFKILDLNLIMTK